LAEAAIRLDKWLWQARFVKTRALAAGLVEAGHLRLNGVHCRKPGHVLRPGDVLTFPLAGEVRVVRVVGLGTRRGPAAEAQALYTEVDTLPRRHPLE
jgi:ribosome-associated heat shock protein Hsp15